MQPVGQTLRRRIKRFFGWSHILRRSQIPIITRLLTLTPDHLVLDIGCGSGELSRYLDKAKRVVGCDLSSAVEQFPCDLRHLAVRSDAARLPFKSRTFDRVLLSSVLQMVESPGPVLEEVARVLKEGGIAVITVPVAYRFLGWLIRLRATSALFRLMIPLPDSSERFANIVMQHFGARGSGWFHIPSLLKTLETHGLRVKSWEYCPRALASFAVEVVLVMKYVAGRSYSVAGKGPMLLYPLIWFDRFLPGTSKGSEVAVVVARKRINE